ncbi:MAG: CalY family protein [Clostridia bacterium]|nr:CalY family protein [Clostridia bacterium]
MKTAKTSKRALLCSVLSIALCLSMLIGTTFAWFTDTATTAVNKITSGTLDVEIQSAAGQAISELSWVKATGHETESVLWEPGCTYTLTPFKVANIGTLALKYKMVITGFTGDQELLDVIHFTVTEGNQPVSLDTFEGHLTAKGTDGAASGMITVSATMDPTAGNDYQGKTLDGVSIKVYATQDTVEHDSNGKDYDQDAAYPATTANELQDALTKGGVVNVTKDLDPEATLTVSGEAEATLDATGKTIANTSGIWDVAPNNWSLVSVQDNAKLTITGGSFQAKKDDCYAVDVQDEGAMLTIKDGDFNGNISAVYAYTGVVIIEGGTFKIQQLNSNNVQEPYGLLLNCFDANYKNKTANIIVKGGSFFNFNPANNAAEGAGTNFVADGYKVVSEEKDGGIWYTVVAK